MAYIILVIKGQYMRIILNSDLVGFSCILILLEFLVHGLLILTFRDDVAIFRVDDVLVDCILLQTSHNILTEHRHVRIIKCMVLAKLSFKQNGQVDSKKHKLCGEF